MNRTRSQEAYRRACDLIPGCVNSPARGFTGRDVIVKFAGCYHGHVDSLLVAAGSSATTLGVPTSPGVPKGCTADTLVLRYNDTIALAEAFRTHGQRIAGVILEPVVG